MPLHSWSLGRCRKAWRGAVKTSALHKLIEDRNELLSALETLTAVWREAFPYIDQSPSFQNALAAIRKAKGQ